MECYESLYVRDYKWPIGEPPILKLDDVLQNYCHVPKEDLCKKALCACQKPKPKEVEFDPLHLMYLRNSRTSYQDAFCIEKPKRLVPEEGSRCDKVADCLRRVDDWTNNPYMIAPDAFRPDMRRPKGCPLSDKPCPSSNVLQADLSTLYESRSSVIKEITETEDLDQKVSKMLLKGQKIFTKRKVPDAANHAV